MSHNLHVAISTGQNVANLIPIRELASPGDSILVLESETAKNRNFTLPLLELLRDEKYKVHEPLKFRDAELVQIFPLIRRLKNWLNNSQNKYVGHYFYFNGGQKMAAIGLENVAREYEGTLVYMDYPAVRLIISNLKTGESKFRPIKRDITLQQVLRINHTEIFDDKNVARRYSREDLSNFPSDNVAEKLYRDPVVVKGILKTMFFAENNSLTDEKNIFPANNGRLMREIFIKIRNEYVREKINISRYERYLDRKIDEEQRENIKQGLFNIISNAVDFGYSQFRKLYLKSLKRELVLSISQEEKEKLVDIGWLKPDTNPDSVKPKDLKMRLGPFFEQAVLDRLVKYLNQTPEIKNIISEVWSNVNFQSIDNPGQVTGEYDILILLKSGVLISLECKSYKFEEKDLFARIARLVRRSGLLNEQWASLMFYTDPELIRKANLFTYLNLQALGITLIPFGLIGQPSEFSYAFPKKEISGTVPAFEDALSRAFAKYIPKISEVA